MTDKGETEFIVNITNKVKTSFDESDRGYAYGSGKDLEIDADFSTATVSSVTAGGRKLASADYSYDGAAKKFAVKTAFLDTLYGETEITVNLSNNQSYKFKVTSDCLFAANFDDDNIPSFYNEYRNATTTAAGWNGTRALHWKGNGGNLMIFYVENYNYGLQTAFEAGKTYCLSFQFKNNWTGEGNPEGFVGMSLSNTALFNLNYLNNTVDGGVASCDANGVWSVKIYFDAPAAGQFTYMYTGYRDGFRRRCCSTSCSTTSCSLKRKTAPPFSTNATGKRLFPKDRRAICGSTANSGFPKSRAFLREAKRFPPKTIRCSRRA